MNRIIKPLMLALVASISYVGFGRDVYSNDFASRTSHNDIPGKQWYETSYVWPAYLCYPNRVNVTNCTSLSAYKDLGKVQDGWSRSHIRRLSVRRKRRFPVNRSDGTGAMRFAIISAVKMRVVLMLARL